MVMSKISKIFNNKINLADKFLITTILLIPLSLAISIFTADFLPSVSSLIFIFIFLSKDLDIFKKIKKEIIFFFIFYLIILTSLFLTEYKSESFLASFFYFRYFLLSLIIFYLLKKYNFFFKIFYKVILLSIGLVVLDSLIQYIFGTNLLGYGLVVNREGEMIYLSGFFNEEKKLGSYLVRFLPLILSIIYFNEKKISLKIELIILSFIGISVFLATERTALLLLLIIYFFYFLLSEKKLFFISIALIVFTFLFTFQKTLTQKYIFFTLEQTGLITLKNPSERPINRDIVRYYSYEHENLSYTGLRAFQNNFLFGTGVKSFYFHCRDTVEKYQYNNNQRKNRLVCSTHPHNTYVQILSEIGIFGFILILFFFVSILFTNFKIILNKNKNNLIKSYFFINLSIIINIMPLIPSGSFFNNWISLMIFFPIGFLLYMRDNIKK
jgi:O-antigen ligase